MSDWISDVCASDLLVALGIFGAALLDGDGMITPAISVLSAVEGLETTAHGIGPFVIPITLVILVLLFSFQSRGTARVAALFGPVMVVWFGVRSEEHTSELQSLMRISSAVFCLKKQI